MLKPRQHVSLTNKVIHQKRRGLAVLCGEQLSFWCRVRKCDFLFGQVTSIHERRPEQKTNHRLTQVFIYMLSVINISRDVWYLTVSRRRVAMLFRLIRLKTQIRLTPQMAFSGTVEQHQALWCSMKSSLFMSLGFSVCSNTRKA